MSAPMVSVVIPCFNQGSFLADALDSVVAQTLPATDITVIDDGSTDETPSVVRRYPAVRYVRQCNRGLAAARNAGLAHASGDFLVFLDADDRLRPEALEIGARELLTRPDCALVWGLCVRIGEHGQPLPTVPSPPVDGDPYELLLRSNFIWTTAAAMFRRAVCGPLMRFDPVVDASADYELYLRLARILPIHGHRAIVAEYRLHGASMSRNAPLMLTSTMEVLRAQQQYVSQCRSYARAYAQGRRSWQEYYGEQLIEQLSQRLRHPRGWIEISAMVGVLARYYPRGLVARVARLFDGYEQRSRRRLRRIIGQKTAISAASGDRETASVRQRQTRKHAI